MKSPKFKKTYCPKCKKHTEHKITQAKTGGKRGSLKKGSIKRLEKRGSGKAGFGNKGRYSKPSGQGKRYGKKASKKINLILTCKECKKSRIKPTKRVKKLELQ